jgi:2-amino-4-hydroxy-6-hydroxymethyldihydropteridine diphosphokinase
MARCLIALGGNINASEAVFADAMQRLERPGLVVEQLSRPFVTRPVGSAAGEEYVNAAAVLECTLAPMSLLKALHEVEDSFGRKRTIHWGPRTLDLDLCLFGDEVIESPALVVPHPAMWYRRFVLDPAVAVAGSMTHPILKQTIEELRKAAMARPLRIEVASGTGSNDEIVSMIEHLKAKDADLREVRFAIVAESSPADSNVFARLLLEYGDEHCRSVQRGGRHDLVYPPKIVKY